MSERDTIGAQKAPVATEIPCPACGGAKDPSCLICQGSGIHYEWAQLILIDEAWRKAPYVWIDPDCPKLILERPDAVGPFASIGGHGFGYHLEEGAFVRPKDHKFGVIIKEGARFHPRVTVDRGSWRDTIIGRNARFNVGSSIGHNCQIGDDCLLNMGATISGSCDIGDSVIIWKHACIEQRVAIGDGAIIGAGSLVRKGSIVRTDEVWWNDPMGVAKFQRMRRKDE